MENSKKSELKRKCEYCNIRLVVAKKDGNLIVAKCPGCQCETHFKMIRRD